MPILDKPISRAEYIAMRSDKAKADAQKSNDDANAAKAKAFLDTKVGTSEQIIFPNKVVEQKPYPYIDVYDVKKDTPTMKAGRYIVPKRTPSSPSSPIYFRDTGSQSIPISKEEYDRLQSKKSLREVYDNSRLKEVVDNARSKFSSSKDKFKDRFPITSDIYRFEKGLSRLPRRGLNTVISSAKEGGVLLFDTSAHNWGGSLTEEQKNKIRGSIGTGADVLTFGTTSYIGGSLGAKTLAKFPRVAKILSKKPVSYSLTGLYVGGEGLNIARSDTKGLTTIKAITGYAGFTSGIKAGSKDLKQSLLMYNSKKPVKTVEGVKMDTRTVDFGEPTVMKSYGKDVVADFKFKSQGAGLYKVNDDKFYRIMIKERGIGKRGDFGSLTKSTATLNVQPYNYRFKGFKVEPVERTTNIGGVSFRKGNVSPQQYWKMLEGKGFKARVQSTNSDALAYFSPSEKLIVMDPKTVKMQGDTWKIGRKDIVYLGERYDSDVLTSKALMNLKGKKIVMNPQRVFIHELSHARDFNNMGFSSDKYGGIKYRYGTEDRAFDTMLKGRKLNTIFKFNIANTKLKQFSGVSIKPTFAPTPSGRLVKSRMSSEQLVMNTDVDNVFRIRGLSRIQSPKSPRVTRLVSGKAISSDDKVEVSALNVDVFRNKVLPNTRRNIKGFSSNILSTKVGNVEYSVDRSYLFGQSRPTLKDITASFGSSIKDFRRRELVFGANSLLLKSDKPPTVQTSISESTIKSIVSRQYATDISTTQVNRLSFGGVKPMQITIPKTTTKNIGSTVLSSPSSLKPMLSTSIGLDLSSKSKSIIGSGRMFYPKSRNDTKSKVSPVLKEGLLGKSDNLLKQSTNPMIMSRMALKNAQVMKQSQMLKQNTLLKQKVTSRTVRIPRMPVVTMPPIIPKFDDSKRYFFKTPKFKLKSGLTFRPYRYVSSIQSRLFNIKGSISKGEAQSGLIVRPIVA